MEMGLINRLLGNEEREHHKDGSYTDRNEKSGTSSTYDKDGNLKEFSITKDPLIGQKRVDSYDNEGNLINSNFKK
jgi:hypothetical protein